MSIDKLLFETNEIEDTCKVKVIEALDNFGVTCTSFRFLSISPPPQYVLNVDNVAATKIYLNGTLGKQVTSYCDSVKQIREQLNISTHEAVQIINTKGFIDFLNLSLYGSGTPFTTEFEKSAISVDENPANSEETPKPEETKSEEPKPEGTKLEEIKSEETPKPEETKPEEPKSEATKLEETKSEVPKSEEPKFEETKLEETKSEEAKPEETKSEEPKSEEKKLEEAKPEEPKSEGTKSEETKSKV